MAAPQNVIRTHQNGQKILFRVEGWGQMDLGLALRRFAEQCLAQGATTLLVDLRDCGHMDSTSLGTLLLLRRAASRCPCGRFALVAPSAECCKILEQMGLSGVLPVATEEELAVGEWTSLCRDLNDVEAFQRNVLEAHEQLANLPGNAGKQFQKLVQIMSKEMEAKNQK